jgi:Domain of unknown function (DUF1876)/Domain of unknown function (DUF1918)
MDAQVGDQYIVNSRVLGKGARVGEIVECIGRGGLNPHFRVRWADGHESIVYPSSDVRVEPSGGREGVERHSVEVDLRLTEDADRCEAVAVMASTLGELTATGVARRHPEDPRVPLIGEELAIARALASLASQLEAAAYGSIQAHEDRPVHLV